MLTKLSRSDLKEFAGGLVLLVLVAVSFSQMGTGLRDWVFPRAVTSLLGVIGFLLIVNRLVVVARRDEPDATAQASADRADRLRHAADVLGISAVAIAYAVLIPLVGFWSTSLFVIAGLAIWLSDRRDAKVVARSVAVALLAVVAAYYIFLHLFYVPIPTGVMFAWLH